MPVRRRSRGTIIGTASAIIEIGSPDGVITAATTTMTMIA